jgi:pilus assembly protein Flp/PilA
MFEHSTSTTLNPVAHPFRKGGLHSSGQSWRAFSETCSGDLLGRFLSDESGGTAIEYALIASGVSIVIAGTVTTIGSSVKNFYVAVGDALK